MAGRGRELCPLGRVPTLELSYCETSGLPLSGFCKEREGQGQCECQGFVSTVIPETLHQSEEVRPGRGEQSTVQEKMGAAVGGGRRLWQAGDTRRRMQTVSRDAHPDIVIYF